jgi:hypothetical protein
MAAAPGKDGAIKVGTTALGTTNNFSFTQNIGSGETTGFGDSYKANIATIKDVSFTCSGAYDKADSGQNTAIWTEIDSGDGDIADMRLYTAAANYWSGAAVLTSVTINSTTDGVITYTANFIGNGTWSYT